MIKAVFWSESKHITRFQISGHANYAEHGQDIVCAAVSALSIAIINGITEIVKASLNCKIDQGLIDCKIENDIYLEDKVQVLIKTLKLGLEEVSKEYPGRIKIKNITK